MRNVQQRAAVILLQQLTDAIDKLSVSQIEEVVRGQCRITIEAVPIKVSEKGPNEEARTINR